MRILAITSRKTVLHGIAQAPFAYPAREDIATGLRMCPHGRYLILYRVDDVKIDIIRIAHAARDLSSLF
ncbi:MAG: type II toxin-antitoxin system RelE/ParE family toxin [Noviherbaspirillum sp.]